MIASISMDFTSRHDATYLWRIKCSLTKGTLFTPPVEGAEGLWGDAIPDYGKEEVIEARSVLTPVLRQLKKQSDAYFEAVRQGANPADPTLPQTTLGQDEWQSVRELLPRGKGESSDFRLRGSVRLGELCLGGRADSKAPIYFGTETCTLFYREGINPLIDERFKGHRKSLVVQKGNRTLYELIYDVVDEVVDSELETCRLVRPIGTSDLLLLGAYLVPFESIVPDLKLTYR